MDEQAQWSDSKAKVQAYSRPLCQTLSVPIDVVNFRDAQDRIVGWAHARSSRYVVLANAHVVVTASRDAAFGDAVVGADMTTPDGYPVAWMLRALGHKGQERVCGPDLMWALLGRCAKEELSVFFYGSKPETLNKLMYSVRNEFPDIQIVGAESPPFTTPTFEESCATIEHMNSTNAGLIFVGLGCPKQEHWMWAHRGQVYGVMLGVGAAFDFYAGTVKRAPLWMRQTGLEWLYRLAKEPRRLWRRYFVTNSLFIKGAILQLLARNNASAKSSRN